MKAILYTSLFCLITSPLYADEIVEITERNLNDPNASENTIRFMFADGLMKMSGQDDTDMIFNSENKVITVISHSDKSYMTFDQDTVSNVQSDIQAAMEQALAQVPPEQRAMVERMMQGNMGGLGGMGGPSPIEVEMPKIEIRETSRTDTINGYDCTYFESYEDNQKEGDHCVATWSELGVSDNIQHSFNAMAEMMEGFLEQLGSMTGGEVDSNVLAYLKDMEGYPVLSRQYSNGQAESESILSSIVEQDLDESEFSPPEGYSQQSMGLN